MELCQSICLSITNRYQMYIIIEGKHFKHSLYNIDYSSLRKPFALWITLVFSDIWNCRIFSPSQEGHWRVSLSKHVSVAIKLEYNIYWWKNQVFCWSSWWRHPFFLLVRNYWATLYKLPTLTRTTIFRMFRTISTMQRWRHRCAQGIVQIGTSGPSKSVHLVLKRRMRRHKKDNTDQH